MASPSSKSKIQSRQRAQCPMCFGTGIQAPLVGTNLGRITPAGYRRVPVLCRK